MKLELKNHKLFIKIALTVDFFKIIIGLSKFMAIRLQR